MNSNLKLALRRHSFNVLLGACAAGLSMPALAQTAAAAAVTAATSEMAAPAAAAAAPADDGSAATMATVQISSNKTRSSVALNSNEIQKILPGTNPLKALQTLPGVSFQTADPWGNNEQNLSLFVHGFSGQQLGYTMDGVPLGDQQYGNYNGLSPQRAVISENVRSVVLSSGAGANGRGRRRGIRRHRHGSRRCPGCRRQCPDDHRGDFLAQDALFGRPEQE